MFSVMHDAVDSQVAFFDHFHEQLVINWIRLYQFILIVISLLLVVRSLGKYSYFRTEDQQEKLLGLLVRVCHGAGNTNLEVMRSQ